MAGPTGAEEVALEFGMLVPGTQALHLLNEGKPLIHTCLKKKWLSKTSDIKVCPLHMHAQVCVRMRHGVHVEIRGQLLAFVLTSTLFDTGSPCHSPVYTPGPQSSRVFSVFICHLLVELKVAITDVDYHICFMWVLWT